MKKYLVCLLTLLSFFALFTLGICAEDATPAEWVLSEDEEALTYGDAVYTFYPRYHPTIIMPDAMYVYEQRIVSEKLEEDHAMIMHNLHNKDIILLTNEVSTRIYVSEAGKEIMDRYTALDFDEYVCYQSPMRANIPATLVHALANGTYSQEAKKVSVISLKDLPKYSIYGFDQTRTIAHEHGAIYVMDETYWYINYDALDNNYFDSQGYFSYRSGSVALTKVDTATMTSNVLATEEEFHIQYTYAEDENVRFMAADPTVVFVVVTVLIGYLLPAVPLALSLVFAFVRGARERKRWLIIAVLSAVWLLLSTVILLLILLS